MIQYHSQLQAERFAKAIIPVPMDYPLPEGLEEDFRIHFTKLCELAKEIYMDMAEKPEEYGVALLDINENERNIVRDSYRTIHRFVDVVNALFLSGKADKHILTVDTAKFKVNVKKVPRYGLILSKLMEFGFDISQFNGKTIDNKSQAFEVEYTDNPYIIDTLEIYCQNWLDINKYRTTGKSKNVNSPIKISPEEYAHHFYRFDYKITADLSKIPMAKWVEDEAAYLCLEKDQKQFYIEFYNRSLKYPDLSFDGDYYFKWKRIARVYPNEDIILILKLNNMDNYSQFMKDLPAHLQEVFNRNYCTVCGFQGATKEFCKFRIHWNLDNKEYAGCAYLCFNFLNPVIDDLDIYFALLEYEYGLHM